MIPPSGAYACAIHNLGERRCARREAVGLHEGEARAPKGPQGAARSPVRVCPWLITNADATLPMETRHLAASDGNTPGRTETVRLLVQHPAQGTPLIVKPLTNTDARRLRLAYAFRLHLPRTFYLPPLRQQVTTLFRTG